jgi:putative intracellular protease/amidase
VRIDIPIFDGFDELDAVGPYEVFQNAAAGGGEFSAHLVTRVPAEVITGSHGLGVIPDGLSAPGADLVLVPGGAWVARNDVGVWGEVQRGEWLPLLARAAEDGAVMASVCTGAMLLAHAGVIGSRRAGTHHSAWADLAATGATVVRHRVVDDGDLLTAGRHLGHRSGPVDRRALGLGGPGRRRGRSDGIHPSATAHRARPLTRCGARGAAATHSGPESPSMAVTPWSRPAV